MSLTGPDESDLSQLPRLDETEIHLLWYVDWWDGPLTGMVEYRGAKCWLRLHHEDESEVAGGGSSHYHYVLYRLTQDQVEEAETWHSSRGEWNGETWVGRDESAHDDGWEAPDLSANVPLGWFTEGRNQDFYQIKVVPPPDSD